MYSRVPPSPSGARISSCLCAPFRAFRFARPCLGGHPGCFAPDTAPGAVGNGSTSPFPQVTAAPQGHFLGPSGLTAHHEQQEEKRSSYSLVLGAHRFTGRQAQLRNLQGP